MTQKLTINFRFEKENERKKIYELQYKAFIKELKHLNEDLYPNKVYYNNIDKNSIYIIAELKNLIIGIASITPPNSKKFSFENDYKLKELNNILNTNFKNDNIMEGRNLFVEKEYRKYNIGSILMILAVIIGKELGAEYVIGKNNENSLKISEKQGTNVTDIIIKNGETNYKVVYQRCDNIIYNGWNKKILPFINNSPVKYIFDKILLNIFEKQNLLLYDSKL